MKEETISQKEKMLMLRNELLLIEAERLQGAKSYSIDELDTYLETILLSSASRIDKSIEAAEKEYEANGELLDAATSLKALRRKHLI